MKTISFSAVMAVVLLSSPVLAEDAVPASATAKRLNARDPNAIRCRSISITGSLIKRERICKTNAQWTSIADSQNREADDLITRSRAGMNPGN